MGDPVYVVGTAERDPDAEVWVVRPAGDTQRPGVIREWLEAPLTGDFLEAPSPIRVPSETDVFVLADTHEPEIERLLKGRAITAAVFWSLYLAPVLWLLAHEVVRRIPAEAPL